MKRLVVALLLASTLCMTGCGDTKKTEPAASTTEEVDKASSTMKEQMGDNAVLPSDSVKRVMAKQWKVIGTDTVYDLKEDGTGTKDDAGLTFECGFDEDNNITIKITMDGEEEGKLYAVTTDDTGYGVVLESLDGGKDIKLLQADTELLDLTDDRAKGLIGKWTDNSGNEYKLKKDGKLVIKSSSGETKGTYCVAYNYKYKQKHYFSFSLLYDFLRPVCCETYEITGDPRSPLRKADLSVLFIFHKPYYRQNTKYH